MEIQNCYNWCVPISKITTMVQLPLNLMSAWTETWWEVTGQQGDSELLKSFRTQSCYIPLNDIFSKPMLGGIRETRKFRFVKIVSFGYPRWPPWQLFWIFQTPTCLIEPKLDERHCVKMENHNSSNDSDLTSADPENFARGGPTLTKFFLYFGFVLVDEKREDPNTTICGPT